MPFLAGENVGPYRITEPLGQGGMASVFKAYHPALDRYVAIKVLHPAFLQDPSFLARFEREAKLVAKLDHPNIVPIYDFAEHEGQPYLVMKFIQGETLKARLGRGEIGPPERLRIIEAVGKGLGYAHKHGILHRDIKPSNILLADDGNIYLADFGLARIAQAGESTLSSDMLMGTPQYISPEQARGERKLDEGTDIYSLGVVIYEMFVGRVPFNADTPFSIIHDHIYTPLPLPRDVNPTVSEPVERMLLKSLAKERTDRFGSVAELVQGLHAALGLGPGSASSVSVRPDMAPTVAETSKPAPDIPASARPGRRWVWIVGGLGVACMCLFAFLVLANRSNQTNQPPTGMPTEIGALTPVPDSEATLAAARSAVATNPADPEAQLALARALADSGEPVRAAGALLEGVQRLRDRGQAGRAIQALASGLEFLGGPDQAPSQVVDATLQAIFLGASQPDVVETVIDELRARYPDWLTLQAAQARAALYRGETEQAQQQVEFVLQTQPGDLLAQTVQAEIDARQGSTAQALGEIDRVLAQPAVPRWLQQFLADLRQNLRTAN